MKVDLNLTKDLDRVYKACTPPASPKNLFDPKIDPFADGDPFGAPLVSNPPTRSKAMDPFSDNPFADSDDPTDNPFF